jgi:hypothetical protein
MRLDRRHQAGTGRAEGLEDPYNMARSWSRIKDEIKNVVIHH